LILSLLLRIGRQGSFKRLLTSPNGRRRSKKVEGFVQGERHSNYLYMHPTDASVRRLANDAIADISSKAAKVRVLIKILPDFMPGRVALPHGWGHQHASGLSVAS
jgi:anaerobic selenocysteine-containing dehydrogenase